MWPTLNVRSTRLRPTIQRIHRIRVVNRLANPLRNARWTNAHTTHAGNPLMRMPRQLKMARNRPIVATLPRSRYTNGFDSPPSRTRRPMVCAACRLPCIATSATPGRLSSEVMSPTANTSG